jgi:tetratricopeptide (TPR) repeat protein
MRSQPTTYRSKIYRDFRNINPAEYGAVVRFYERNESAIAALDFDEYVELLLSYTHALFELGLYNKHLRMADVVIELSIVENLITFNGEELYENTLFRKAASYFYLQQYDKAEYIMKELIKINPNDKMNSYFLERCLVKKNPKNQQTLRAFSMVLLLSAAIFICVEMLIVRPLFAEWVNILEVTRNILFGIGGFVLAFSFFGFRLIAKFKVYRFQRSVLKK